MPISEEMNELKQRQLKLINEFSHIKSWEDRYRQIIAMGKSLPPLSSDKKLDEYKVRGCQSQVWLLAHRQENNKIIFTADSDALIVRGLVAILLQIYSDSTPDEILNTPPDFIQQLGLASHLSPSRANGLYAMVKQIFYYATAFKSLDHPLS